MHLALDMGRTVAELENMSEREFGLWQRFSNQFMLPSRRFEVHFAQLSLIMAKTMGNAKNVTLQDFLFERHEEPETKAEIGANILGAIASKKVYLLGQGRKVKEAS